jgi:hypothetical protein
MWVRADSGLIFFTALIRCEARCARPVRCNSPPPKEDVVLDMDMALDHIVPESLSWLHTDEGPECVLFQYVDHN